MNDSTRAKLEVVAVRWRQASAAYQLTREEFARTIRGAHDDGASYAEIAAVLGITRQRAHELATEGVKDDA